MSHEMPHCRKLTTKRLQSVLSGADEVPVQTQVARYRLDAGSCPDSTPDALDPMVRERRCTPLPPAAADSTLKQLREDAQQERERQRLLRQPWL
jgi:hypothetical protein